MREYKRPLICPQDWLICGECERPLICVYTGEEAMHSETRMRVRCPRCGLVWDKKSPWFDPWVLIGGKPPFSRLELLREGL